MEAEERALVEKAKQDPTAFGVLYELHVDRIYNYIYQRTGNQHDAEDLTARTFYRALANIRYYAPRGAPFSAWLYRIAHNLVANWHRDRSRRKVVCLDDLTATSGESDGLERTLQDQEQEAALRRAIRQLGPERQQLLILKFSEGLSNAEIGALMGRSEGAIKSLYHRTLVALREELANEQA